MRFRQAPDRLYRTALLLVSALLLPASPVSAATIFDNFGTAFPFYDATTAYRVGSASYLSYPEDFAPAMRFTTGAVSSYLEHITLAMHPHEPGNDGWRYRLTIYADDSVLPGARIESVEFINSNYVRAAVVSVNTLGTTILQADTPYWLALEPVAGSYAGWNWTVGSQRYGTIAFYDLPPASAVWTTYPPNQIMSAFQMSGSPIPVPSAIWLLFSGLGGLALARKY